MVRPQPPQKQRKETDMNKILWFDLETTGLDPVTNDPIQIAGMVEVEGEIMEEFNILCKPFDMDSVSDEALEVNKRTRADIEGFQEAAEAKQELDGILNNHIDKFNRNDKFYPGGYNVKFDIDFLAQWFRKHRDNYLGSYWNWRSIDPMPFLNVMAYKGELDLPNLKLETVCEHFGIKLDAHDALSDVKATRELVYKLNIL